MTERELIEGLIKEIEKLREKINPWKDAVSRGPNDITEKAKAYIKEQEKLNGW